LNEETDDALVALTLAGETRAFAVLVKRHQWSVRAVVSGVMDRSTIENLVQQTFVNAYEHLEQYRQGEALGAWLCGIARNLLRQELRRSSRESRQYRMYREYLDLQLNADGDFEAAQRRLIEVTRRCRDALAEAAAQAISLRYEQALPVDAIATALGRTALATRQLLFRARLAIKECVDKKFAEGHS
jgi:RNA polymerase sigma-70 factor (ECF subfamily)